MDNLPCFEYLNDGKGFEAKIKLAPEHFIVEELSSFDGEIQPQNTSSNVGHNVKRPTETQKECASDSQKRRRISDDNNSKRKVLKHSWDDVDHCNQRLEELLGSEIYTNLHNFAEKVKYEAGKITENRTLMKIGTFSGRDERTFVHRSVRLIYPFLKTITTPHTGEVSVQSCPNYWKFSVLLGDDMSNSIFRFIHIDIFENVKTQLTVEGSQYTKDKRRQIHHLIASCFGKFMEARTVPSSTDDNQQVIIIRRKPHLNKTDKSAREDTGVITAFTLWKKNCETYAAIHHLGRHLNIPHNFFNFAGIKDKRAITTQRCTVTGISPDKFEAACKSLPKYLKVSDCQQVLRVIHLGELICNRFCIKLIRIRNLQQATDKLSIDKDILSAVEDLQMTGFINYFGPQRFGRHISQHAGTDKLLLSLEAPAIGLAMLQNDFKKAVDILLSPSKDMKSDSDKAKKHFQETGNVGETLKLMPSQKLRELSVLRTLKRFDATDNDACIKALLSIPHSSRLLYVHSFSSYIWNEIATERIRKYGNKIVEGDLVMDSNTSHRNNLSKVMSVTAEVLAQNTYTLKDVVLPVPGSQVFYPPCLEKEYQDILEKFSVDSNQMFRILALKIYAPGAYRKLVQSPENLSMKVLPHGHSSETGQVMHKTTCTKELSSGDAQSDTSDRSFPAYENFDIELTFDLPPSCYATTFLSALTRGNLK